MGNGGGSTAEKLRFVFSVEKLNTRVWAIPKRGAEAYMLTCRKGAWHTVGEGRGASSDALPAIRRPRRQEQLLLRLAGNMQSPHSRRKFEPGLPQQ